MKGQQAKVFGGPGVRERLWQGQGRQLSRKEWILPAAQEQGPGPPAASGAEHSLTHLLRFLTHSSCDGSHTVWCGPLCLRPGVRAAMEIQYRPYLSLVSSPKSVHLPNTVLFLLTCLSLSTCKVACEGPAPETQAQ